MGGVGIGQPVGLGVRAAPVRSGPDGVVLEVGDGPDDDDGRLGIVGRSVPA